MLIPTQTHLHDTRLRDVILSIVLAVGVARLRPSSATMARISLSLARLLIIDALLAKGHTLGFEILEYGVSRHCAVAFTTARRSPRAVALYQSLREDARIGLHIVDVLSVIREQLAFVLQEFDKSVSEGESVRQGQNLFRQLVEVTVTVSTAPLPRLNGKAHVGSSSKVRMSKTSSGLSKPLARN